MSMEAVTRGVYSPDASEVGSADAVWGVTGVMSKDILPDGPGERRWRKRLYALRAMDRLGLLGEENLIPTLARRPALRWLANERGARWEILIELGRLGEPGAFEEAVEWALERHPSPEEARAYVRRLRSAALSPDDAGYRMGGSIAQQAATSGPRPLGPMEREEGRP